MLNVIKRWQRMMECPNPYFPPHMALGNSMFFLMFVFIGRLFV